ncbi:MAG: glycosyltransferase [Acidimicrobiales bacterium]
MIEAPAARAAYASFDRFPTAKGAAVHIGHAAATLFDRVGPGLLHVLGGDGLPPFQVDETPAGTPVLVVRAEPPATNLLERAVAYGEHLRVVLGQQADELVVVQGRDPWSIAPLLDRRRAALVYEVNGLPSVELPETRPAVAGRTVERLRELEDRCLRAADLVLTPSAVLGERLVARGVPADRLHVVPNGADPVDEVPARPDGAPDRYVVYVGALQPWQGLPVALRALARLGDLDDLRLVVCSSVGPKRARGLRRLARRLGVDDRVDWHHQLRHDEVAAWLAHAELSLAPLTDGPRNVEQGCCPLKVLESLAAGTPVVASDLPAVRELVVDGEHGRLVPPDRPAELARAVRVLLEYPDEAARLGRQGRAHVAAGLTWDDNRRRTLAAYDALGLPRPARDG